MKRHIVFFDRPADSWAYNLRTRRGYRLSAAARDVLRHATGKWSLEDYRANLVEHRDVIDDILAMLTHSELLVAQDPQPAVASFGPRTVYLSLGFACNLRCRYCYVRHRRIYDMPPFTAEDWLKAYGRIRGLVGAPLQFVLTGGEPLLFDGWLRVAREIAAGGDALHLYTNGTMIDTDCARALSDIDCGYIGVSIDSPSPERNDAVRGVAGSYRASRRGIDLLLEAGCDHVYWQSVLTPTTLQDVEALIDEAARSGARGISLGPVDPHGQAQNNEDVMLDAAQMVDVWHRIDRKRSEYLGQAFHIGWSRSDFADAGEQEVGTTLCNLERSVHIDPWGYVTPCPVISSRDHSVAHVWDDDFEEAVVDSHLATLGRQLTKASDCHNCSYRFACRGGCRANAFVMNGNLSGCDTQRRDYYRQLGECYAQGSAASER